MRTIIKATVITGVLATGLGLAATAAHAGSGPTILPIAACGTTVNVASADKSVDDGNDCQDL